jgi:hypothetical protein
VSILTSTKNHTDSNIGVCSRWVTNLRSGYYMQHTHRGFKGMEGLVIGNSETAPKHRSSWVFVLLHFVFRVFSICQNLCSECLWAKFMILMYGVICKACGCRLVCFHVLQLLSIRFTQRKGNLCRTRKFAMKHQQGLDWKSNFTWLSYGYWQCIFVDFWFEYIDPPNCFHYLSVE